MGNTSSRVTEQDKAILDLKNQRDKLHRYQKRVTLLTDKETDIARRALAQGDKKRALLALRRKKYQESLLIKTDAQLDQLEKLASSVEFALISKDVVFGLQQGTKVLQEIHKEMGGIEHVEKLMGETADAIAYQNDVSEMLGGRMTNQDEEEVEEELAALEADMAVESLPSAPQSNPQAAEPATPQTEPLSARREQKGQEQESIPEPAREALLA